MSYISKYDKIMIFTKIKNDFVIQFPETTIKKESYSFLLQAKQERETARKKGTETEKG